MKYMGSKRRVAKEIIPIMLKNSHSGQCFYDMFCGGCNLIDKIPSTFKRFANDINPYVIALFKELQKDNFSFPDHIGEAEYKQIQKNKSQYPDWLIGYVGFNLSFGGKFFGGYGRDKAGVRNYENEAQQNLKAQQNLIKDVTFCNSTYYDIKVEPNSIIYCDPPYANTTKYATKWFDYQKFYDWCREKSREGNNIYISEYNMPDDFKCIWQKEICSSLTQNTGAKKGIEKLFTFPK